MAERKTDHHRVPNNLTARISVQISSVHSSDIVQDLCHVFLNNFEKAKFLFFFILFTIFFTHSVNVIFKKRELLTKWFFTAFVRFKHRCKMSGVILKCAKSV